MIRTKPKLCIELLFLVKEDYYIAVYLEPNKDVVISYNGYEYDRFNLDDIKMGGEDGKFRSRLPYFKL